MLFIIIHRTHTKQHIHQIDTEKIDSTDSNLEFLNE